MYKKILVATEGSKYSEAAVKESIKIAKNCKIPLVLLSVVDITEEFESLAPGLEEKMVEKAVKIVEKAGKQSLKSGVKTEMVVKTGDAFEEIIKTAKSKKTDLIVMGSHGRTGMKRLLMGSVTSKVIGHADCQVLVVK